MTSPGARRSSKTLGVLAAVLSCTLGGSNTAATRYLMGAVDPVTLAALRFGLGFLLVLPLALVLRCRWPRGRDWIAVALLGLLFFALFMTLFNWSLRYTTAARGAPSASRHLWRSSSPAISISRKVPAAARAASSSSSSPASRVASSARRSCASRCRTAA